MSDATTVDAVAVDFFMEHAGYSVLADESMLEGQRRSARLLADAEARLKAGPYFVGLEPDPDGWDADVPWDGPVWIVTLYSVADEDKPVVLGSVGGVGAYEGAPYLRVVAAELAAEYLPASD